MYPLFQLSIAALTASIVSAGRVLVLGKSLSPLWHETHASSTFSPAGLTDLALNSLGLRTGRVSSRSAVQSPLQADIFAHSKLYALLIVEDESTASLEAINAHLSDVNVFHELYPAETCNVKVPVAVAQKFQLKYHSAAYCAGNAALCASVKVSTLSESAELLQQVLADNSFLNSRDEQDVVFAKQLAQVMQLTAELKQHGDDKMLYIVGISSLHGDKQRLAQQTVTTVVTEFLTQLMNSKQVAAAQVMMGRLPTAVQQATALSRRARNRKLASSPTDKEDESGEDDGEDDEGGDEDKNKETDEKTDEEIDEEKDLTELDAAGGSLLEDDDDFTSATNSSIPGSVSIPDIAEYQIILWTSVMLGALLLGAVLAMANMDAGRDSLLYAKFIADVNGRKTN
ncbi:unnamed protein product [Peronospora belbahrii]|uniref:Protein BIG1 n=1 Tax=Peronospora belbahrii TaxID=622444 RepID=A0AAU9L734_9STRA|nr:unnamed protein product [Peronospora belbahrii]